VIKMSKVEFLNLVALIIAAGGTLNAFSAGIAYFYARQANKSIATAGILMIIALVCAFLPILIVQTR
jgi:hypothetical protein